jgi:hypothetical protein
MARRTRTCFRSARGPLLALALLAVAALPSAANAARASKTITVLPSTLIQMTGSDIYCSVLERSTGTIVACFHDPGGPTSSKSKGYAIAASDLFAGIERPGSTRTTILKSEPSLARVAVFSGGQSHKTLVQLGLDDVAAVGGTHMAVFVTTAKGGGNAIGVIYVDGSDNAVVGTYTAGISDHYVTLVKVVGVQKSKVVFRHAVC